MTTRNFCYISSIVLISGLMLFCLVGEGKAACGELLPNESISRGESIVSCNGFFMLTMSESEDGFPVLYRINETGGVEFLWSPDADSYIKKADNEFTLSMQDDGNLVLYLATASGSGPIWSSKTDGHPGAWLAVQNDGNLVVYDTDGKDIWASHTVSPPICSALFYPSNEWQRAGYDLNSVCLGYGQDESSLEFDTDWGDDIVAYERENKIQLLSSRTIFLAAGTYTFTVGSDDGARLWIDDKIKIDQWLDRGYTTDSVTLTFKSDGNHKFRLDYYENTGGARLSFEMAVEPPELLPGCGKLLSGESIGRRESIVSCDGRFTLDLQTDGNLVLYQEGEAEALWASDTNDGWKLSMTEEGLLVLDLADGVKIWPPSFTEHPGAWLAVQDDGNMVIYDVNGKKVWATNTSLPSVPPPAIPPPAEECACVEGELMSLPGGGYMTLPNQCSAGCKYAGGFCETIEHCTISPLSPETSGGGSSDGTPSGGRRFLLANPLKWESFEDLVDAVIKFLIMISAPIAAIMFVIAGFYFVTSAGDPVKAQTGRRIMIYTAVGLAVILLASGLIKVLQSLLGGS